MNAFLLKHLSDILILIGCGLLIYATWILSWVAAIYVGGGILIVLGILIGIGGRAVQSPPAERGEE